MFYHQSIRSFVLFVLLFTVAPGFNVSGQTSAALMLKPWAPESSVEMQGRVYMFGEGKTRDGIDADERLTRYEAKGRYRLDPSDPYSPSVGMDYTYLAIKSSHPMLPERLTDQSVGVGFGLSEGEAWKVGTTLAVGYAGNNAFGEGDATYAVANLIFDKKLAADQSLQFIINYNGNRSIFPDVPLPSIVWTKRESETLVYSLGLPYSAISYTPDEQWSIKAGYYVPFTFNVDVEYKLNDKMSLVGSLQNKFEAYKLDGMRDTKRLFLTQRLIEGGVRYQPTDHVSLDVALGFAFDQEFESGFDARDLEDVVKISDVPYLRVGLDVAF